MNFDLSKKKLSDINKYLQNIDRKSNVRKFKIENPSGHHAICAGLKDDIDVSINGHFNFCSQHNKECPGPEPNPKYFLIDTNSNFVFG